MHTLPCNLSSCIANSSREQDCAASSSPWGKRVVKSLRIFEQPLFFTMGDSSCAQGIPGHPAAAAHQDWGLCFDSISEVPGVTHKPAVSALPTQQWMPIQADSLMDPDAHPGSTLSIPHGGCPKNRAQTQPPKHSCLPIQMCLPTQMSLPIPPALSSQPPPEPPQAPEAPQGAAEASGVSP